ncbi:MAG: GIY-YIG nuclease family protein [Tepidisphaeraceae bacterium]
MDETGPFSVYILRNARGQFYVGSTGDVAARLSRHNDNRGAKTYTHKNGPWVLVWQEQQPTRSAAVIRERQIKSMKSARWIRENLLNGRAPARRD